MKNKKIINEIVLFTLIAIYFASNIILREVSNLDELWNYNFASNISNGLIPYRDFNMVVTPLLSLIGGAFLYLFGKELIVIRILNILLSTSIIFVMYKIMKELKIKNYISLLLLAILSYIFKKYAMFDYNYATSLVSLIIVFLEIRNYNNDNKKYQLIIGVLGGICITLKHTTGLIIAIALLGYKILCVRDKSQIKSFLNIFLWKLIGVAIPVVLMIIYLLINDALYHYIDYCILGISTFSNKVSYFSRLIQNNNLLIRLLSIMPVTLIGVLILYLQKKDENALILFSFGISGLAVVYPISDETHLISGLFIILIGVAYILNKLIKKDLKAVKIFLYVFIMIYVLNIFLNAVYIYIKSNKNSEIPHYKYLIMEENQINNINSISKYIQASNKKIYILDANASYYMIPINRYNKDYDMFCLGNFGSKGELGQIENLKREKGNINILIKNKKYRRNWQNPEQVRQWVITNMNKKGEIGIFDIYE